MQSSKLVHTLSSRHLTRYPSQLNRWTSYSHVYGSISICHQRTMSTNAAATQPISSKSNVLDYSSPHTKSTAWSTPGPAAFDFRSDVVTTPTSSMLSAITYATLLDDVFGEDPTTRALEASVAQMTGFPAALLVMSGTMGNQVSLRSHLQGPPHSVLCDHRAHIMVYEAGGVSSLSGALVKAVAPKNGRYLTLEDVKANATISDDIHASPTRVVSLENTLNGMIMPLAEMRRVSEWARSQSPPVLVHLDGARLWEAVASGAGTLKDFCACVDSVSLCFSKGLGAPIGSIVCGSEAFIKRSRWVRKSIGGGVRQAGVISAAAQVAVDETFLGGVLAQTHENAKKIEKLWVGMGGKVVFPVETNMVWLDFDEADGSERFVALAKEEGLKTGASRLVVHYQIGDEAISRLERAMRRIQSERTAAPNGDHKGK